MARRRLVAAWLGLVILTLGGMYSVYFLLFSLWMLAYPKADPVSWRPIFYQRLTISGLIGVLWVMLCIWLSQQRKAHE
jgi:hypothetical protein